MSPAEKKQSMQLFETTRLLVRQLTPDDTDAMYNIFKLPDVSRYMGDGTTLTRELCEKWITVSLENYRTKGFGASAVIEKDSGEFIGCSGIIYDPERLEPEIIYAFHPDAWGKGYASELVPGMLSYGMAQHHLVYIQATIDSRHKVSQRIVEKAGMVQITSEEESDGSVTLVYQINAERQD